MQRKFITNLAFLLFLNLLIKPFWILGIDRAVQNEVGAASYGLYAALFNFSFLFNILLDFGITNFNNRNIARHNHLLKKHLSGILTLRLVLAGVYFLVSLLVASLVGYSGRELVLLTVLLFNQGLLSLILYLRSNIAGLHLFRIDSVVSVLDRSIMIVICGIVLWGGVTDEPFRIEWFVWIQTLAYATTALLTFAFLKTKLGDLKTNWDSRFALVILKKSYPFAILILLMTFYNRIDSVMLERLLPGGAEQAGIYAQAYRLLDSVNMIAYLFSVLLLPMFSTMIKQKKPMEDLVELSFSLIAVPALIVMAACTVYSQDIMDALYIHHVEESAAVFSVVIHCFLAMGSVYIFGTLLTAHGSLKALNIVAASAMCLNIALNLWLIPRYQAMGAAFSGLITQAVAALVQIALAHRIFGFKIRWGLAARYLILSLMVIASFLFSMNWSSQFVVNILVGSVVSLLTALLLKLIRPIEIIRLLKDREQA
ncbi:MAG: hypothetical protein RLZZ630_1713 [Bacteroidota bacterium]